MDIKDKIEIGMQERDYSIDILKFLAVFLIINSHMDALYVKYSMLATGGQLVMSCSCLLRDILYF